MQITVQLPDDLAQHADPGHEALEAFVIEGYRSGVFSQFQAGELLGLSRLEFEAFLKDRGIYNHAYDAEDFAEDMTAIQAEGKRMSTQG